MNETKIEWVKNPDGSPGYTWNPITGCLNHDNGLCRGGDFLCYAYRLAHGRLKSRYLSNANVAPVQMTLQSDYQEACRQQGDSLAMARDDPFYPRFWPGRLAEMLWQQGTKPKGIFVCDMSNLFGIGIPEAWQHQIFSAIKCNPQHRFYLLTKQPQNLARWSPFPDNCYVGVTATGPRYFAEACNYLRDIEAPVKFLSIEPYLEEIVGSRLDAMLMHLAGINWLIIGGQAKPEKLPKIEWLREIVEAAHKAGIKVFLKDNLNPIFAENDCAGFNQYQDQFFTIIDNFPTRYHLRQEMPNREGT